MISSVSASTSRASNVLFFSCRLVRFESAFTHLMLFQGQPSLTNQTLNSSGSPTEILSFAVLWGFPYDNSNRERCDLNFLSSTTYASLGLAVACWETELPRVILTNALLKAFRVLILVLDVAFPLFA